MLHSRCYCFFNSFSQRFLWWFLLDKIRQKLLWSWEKPLHWYYSYSCRTFVIKLKLFFFDIWNTLEEDIIKFSVDGYIYLQGDFNSRTSNTPDFVQNDSLQYTPLPNSYICDSDNNLRNNLDKSVNAYGHQWSSLWIALGLIILNGRFLGDSQGNFTSFQYNGCSVVDYGIICRNISDKINYY
jgi:hypothetical protein